VVRHRTLALAELLAVMPISTPSLLIFSSPLCATYVDDSAAISTDPFGVGEENVTDSLWYVLAMRVNRNCIRRVVPFREVVDDLFGMWWSGNEF
jgi:hypothetical protein